MLAFFKDLFLELMYRLRIKRRYKKGSTVINIIGPGPDEVKEELAEIILTDEQSVQKFLCTYILPDNKKLDVVSFIADFRKKNPDMGNERIFRKAAEYFNLKKFV